MERQKPRYVAPVFGDCNVAQESGQEAHGSPPPLLLLPIPPRVSFSQPAASFLRFAPSRLPAPGAHRPGLLCKAFPELSPRGASQGRLVFGTSASKHPELPRGQCPGAGSGPRLPSVTRVANQLLTSGWATRGRRWLLSRFLTHLAHRVSSPRGGTRGVDH